MTSKPVADRKKVLVAAAVSILITALLLAHQIWLVPLYADGIATSILSRVNVLLSITVAPVRHTVAMFIHYTSPWLPIISYVLTGFLIFLVMVAMIMLARLRRIAYAPIAVEPSNEPRGVTRRTALKAGGVALLASAGGLASYGAFLSPRKLEIARQNVTILDLPPGLDGLTILQITDTHHGPWIDEEFLQHVVEQGNLLAPDLILLTGDYVSDHARYIARGIQPFANLKAPLGVLGVLGNHDHWEDAELTRKWFGKIDIPLIDNERRILSHDREWTESTSTSGLAIGGIGDIWTDRIDVRSAFLDIPKTMPRLLLSHNPDAAEISPIAGRGERVDLMLCGHTHGGQVCIPAFGTPIIPSKFGQKYARGLVDGPGCKVYISHGIGLTGLPVRLGISPQLNLITLKSSTA